MKMSDESDRNSNFDPSISFNFIKDKIKPKTRVKLGI